MIGSLLPLFYKKKISNGESPIVKTSPILVSSPIISGIPNTGQTLTATNGTWSGSPTSYSYQWKRDGASIGSATSSTYVVTTSDYGTDITCEVTATNAYGSSSPATSNAIPVSSLLSGLINWWEASEGPGNWANSVSGAPELVYTAGANAATKSVFTRGYGTRMQLTNVFETSAVQASPNGTGSFTVAGWFSIDTTQSFQVLFAQWGGSNRRYRGYYDKAAGQFKFNISVNGSATATTLSVTYSETLLLRERTLVIFEHDAENDFIRLKIGNHYTLGSFTSTPHSTGIFNGTGQKIGVGCDNGSSGNKASAWFGLIGIWNRKLTSDEHIELWNKGRGLRHPFTPTVDEILAANEFAFIHWGDTQHAVEPNGRRAKQMGWNAADMMLEEGLLESGDRLMTHVGDVRHKQTSTTPNDPTLWTASYNLSRFFMDKGGFYGVQYGNHDMDDIGLGPSAGRQLTEYHAAYPQSYISGQSSFNGGFYDSTLDNYYHLFTAGGEDWILISTEAVPRDVVMVWVQGLLTTYSSRKCIYVSHQIFSQTQGQASGATIFMDSNDNTMTANSYNTMGDRNGGTDQWNYLKGYDNVVLLISGHDNTDRGNGYVLLTKDSGNKAVGLLINFQEEDNQGAGQQGWISFIKINTTNKTIRVKNWSVAQQTYNWTAVNLSITPELLNVTIDYN